MASVACSPAFCALEDAAPVSRLKYVWLGIVPCQRAASNREPVGATRSAPEAIAGEAKKGIDAPASSGLVTFAVGKSSTASLSTRKSEPSVPAHAPEIVAAVIVSNTVVAWREAVSGSLGTSTAASWTRNPGPVPWAALAK